MKRGESLSYSNGWSSSEVPSYMAITPPSSAQLPPASDDHDNKKERNDNGTSSSANNNNNKSSFTTGPKKGFRRRRLPVVVVVKDKENRYWWWRLYQKWMRGGSRYASLAVAIVLWYNLGVLSIGTSKLLLTSCGVPPLFLTLQQLLFGSSYLRFLLHLRAFGSAGLQPWPQPPPHLSPMQRRLEPPDSFGGFHLKDLILAGVYFSVGFLATNLSFSQSSAAFVETIKAGEPITSAGVAVANGIEVLSRQEVLSLGTIVAGVLLSTLANSGGATQDGNGGGALQSCLVVMTANLCFSFRGLHQKLFRARPFGTAAVLDDLNLQYRMQITGVVVLLLPTLLWDARSLLTAVVFHWDSSYAMRYVGLSLVNGFAFTSYNLASTFVLTRISVVHHAALNCIRRIFAIIVTSIAFAIPITLLGALGILISFCGFLAFTHYKTKRQKQPKPISTLLPMSAV